MGLPELSIDARTSIEVVGVARSFSGRMLIALPYAAPIGTSRGRRYRVEWGADRTVLRVVLSVAGRAALRPPGSTPLAEGQSVQLRMRALPIRRRRHISDDVLRALAAAGTSLDLLGEADAHHLLLMVDEASDPAIRTQRIQAAVDAVRRATATRP